jgi:hypothetical protein
VTRVDLNGSKHLKFDSGYTRLYVAETVALVGNASIIVEPGARAEIYIVGSVSASGGGVVNNDGRAVSFQLYSLGTGSVSLSGSASFTGLVYAPRSSVTLSGGGAGNEVAGAVVGDTISLGGHIGFHYDESLRTAGPTRGYTIMSWQEL